MFFLWVLLRYCFVSSFCPRRFVFGAVIFYVLGLFFISASLVVLTRPCVHQCNMQITGTLTSRWTIKEAKQTTNRQVCNPLACTAFKQQNVTRNQIPARTCFQGRKDMSPPGLKHFFVKKSFQNNLSRVKSAGMMAHVENGQTEYCAQSKDNVFKRHEPS